MKKIFIILLFLAVSHSFSQTEKECESSINKGIELMNSQKFSEAIVLHKKALNIANKKKYYALEFKALNNLGIDYFMITDYESAINYYLKAYHLAISKKDEKNQMVVINNIAVAFILNGQYEKAKYYFNKALGISIENDDAIRIGYYKTNLGLLSIEMNDLESARNYFNQAIEILPKENRESITAKTGLLKIKLNLKKADEVNKQAKNILEEAIKKSYLKEAFELRILIAEANFILGNLKNSEIYAKEVINNTDNFEWRKQAFDILYKINMQNEDFKKAIKYKDSLFNIDNKLSRLKKKVNLEKDQLKFELLSKENDNKLILQKVSFERKIMNLSIIIVVLILIVVFLLLKKRIINLSKKLAQKSEQVQGYEEEIQSIKKEATEELQKLQNDIEKRNQTITERILFQTKRNDLIDKCIKFIENKSFSKQEDLENLLIDLRTTRKEDLKWEDYLSNFESINPSFIRIVKSKHPNLNAEDLKFLTYIFLGITTKEISNLLNITGESVRKRKERLLKKMKLENHTSLYDYIVSLN